MTTTTLDHIRAAVVMCAGADPDAITPEARLDALDVDSLTLAEVVWSLEDRIGKTFEFKTRPDTVADHINLIESTP